MSDPTEAIRRQEVAHINSTNSDKDDLVTKFGQVWTTAEMQAEFSPLGFAAPYVMVCRKSDNKKGTLQFLHSPRYYFNWVEN